jgi:hypothetical protein
MDFTVGPAGVGPPTAITPVDADEGSAGVEVARIEHET